MNDTLHGWVLTLLTLPIPAWAAIASACVGLALPWLVEANVPMDEWSGWRFRLMTYGVAIVAGMVAAVTIWHSLSALALWVPALGMNVARDIASHFLPWLSPRRQIVLRRNDKGEVIGVKEGDDKTQYFNSDPPAPK